MEAFNMKKALVILVALALVSTLAFAGTQKGGGTVVVKTMAYGDNANPEGQNWVRIVDAFQKANPNIKIEYEMLYDEAYHNKVTARLASGDVPHLAYMGGDVRWGKAWEEAKQQFDHKPYMDKNYYDLSLIPAMGPKGEIWEIPLGTSNICTVLYFNTELAKSLGLSEPKTYEDMVAMVPKAQEAGIDVVSIDGADGWAWGSCVMSCFAARLSGDSDFVKKAVAGQYKFTDQSFVDALNLLSKMVKDGVLNANCINVDYGTNISNFSNKKALFMVQGQWAAGSIVPEVQATTKLMAWPKLPGEKANMAGSVAAAIQVGYGLTQAGAKDAKVRDAAMLFLKFFNSTEEVIQRLKDGAIVAPILKTYTIPADLVAINKQKIDFAKATGGGTNVIDAFLGGAANDALNAGMQKIVAGTATGKDVAAEVQGLLAK
jgi:raffinose/stachyose/melibiose transport system substrate-binding protein